ncbi:TadE family protein [Streptomyces sp. NPDC059881]|uniref:TadE family protein n=1 Tax=Streptomyces sp. NPDC059881 TaxID=3346986 RepID=UPI00364AFCDD
MRKRILRLRKEGDRGQTALEYVGWIPFLLLIALAAIQLGLAAYAVQQAGTGARAAARSESIGNGGGKQAGKEAMSDWAAGRTDFDRSGWGEEVTMTARVTIPSIIPGIDDFGEATRSATMPVTD